MTGVAKETQYQTDIVEEKGLVTNMINDKCRYWNDVKIDDHYSKQEADKEDSPLQIFFRGSMTMPNPCCWSLICQDWVMINSAAFSLSYIVVHCGL